MTQSEKAQLRYIALLEQIPQVQGDMARTITSSANALRVLKQQFTILGREIGNIFIPLLNSIVPIAIAVVKVLSKVARAIAQLFGFTIPDLNWDSVSQTTGQVATDLDDANGSASRLKRQLAGFDELNNLTTPGAGGSGSDDIGGGDFDIELPEYDMLEGLDKQIEDLTDQVMEFFGLTEDKAGKLTWSFKDMDDKAQGLIITLGILAGIKGLGGVSKALDGVKTLLGGLGLGKVGTAISKFIGNPIEDAIFAFSAVKGGAATFGEGVGLTLSSIGSSIMSIGSVLFGIIAPLFTLNWGIKEVNKSAFEVSDTFDLFDNTISKTTKNAVEPFMEQIYSLDTSIWNTQIKGLITTQDAQNIQTQVNSITSTIQSGLVDKISEFETKLNDANLFPDLTKRQTYLSELEASVKDYETLLSGWQTRANEIVSIAAQEGRALTEAETAELLTLEQNMANSGITILSDTQKEALAIKSKFNENLYEINASSAAEAISQAVQLRNSAVAEAQKEFDEKVALAEEMKATLPGFSQEMYDEIISDAKLQRDEEILTAQNAYDEIMLAAQQKFPEITRLVNLETGEMKTSWQIFKDDVAGYLTSFVQGAINSFEDMKNKIKFQIDVIKSFFSNLFNTIKQPFDRTIQYFRDNFKLPQLSIPKLPNIGLSVYYTNDGGMLDKAAQAIGLQGIPHFNFYTYATGGFPDTGEFFMARENGIPEMVGRIGNRTAVANNDQIVESIKQGVYEAQVSANGGNNGTNYFNIQIGNREAYRGVANNVKSENNRYGVTSLQI